MRRYLFVLFFVHVFFLTICETIYIINFRIVLILGLLNYKIILIIFTGYLNTK